MALTPRLLEPFSGPASALFDDPDTVIARKRRSPNELGGPVGAVPQDIRPERRTDRSAARRRSGSGALMDGLKPAAAPRSHAAPQPDAEPDPAPERRNDIEDLSRIGRALGDAGEPEDAASVTTPARAADALSRFQRRRGLRVDGWAAPGGETDRALDNIARRRKRLAAQNRPEASETLDDRLAVFVETREERDRLARDEIAALLSTVTGRIFARDHAGTTDPEAARPALLQALARLRAERQAPPYDDSRPPPDEPPAEDPPEEGEPPEGEPPEEEPPEEEPPEDEEPPEEDPPEEDPPEEDPPEDEKCERLREELERKERLYATVVRAQAEAQNRLKEIERELGDNARKRNEALRQLLETYLKSEQPPARGTPA
eukprot:g1069.t1